MRRYRWVTEVGGAYAWHGKALLLVNYVKKNKWEWIVERHGLNSVLLGKGYETTRERAQACAIAALALG